MRRHCSNGCGRPRAVKHRVYAVLLTATLTGSAALMAVTGPASPLHLVVTANEGRNYPAATAPQTHLKNESRRDADANASLRPLAGYLLGADHHRQRMASMAPSLIRSMTEESSRRPRNSTPRAPRYCALSHCTRLSSKRCPRRPMSACRSGHCHRGATHYGA